MKEFFLIARGKEQSCSFKDADDRAAFMKRFQAWEEDLTKKKLFVRSDQLPTKFKRVKERQGAFDVMDGPFTETKELLTGFFLIRAEGLDHAVEISKQCPVTRFDDLEVYELGGSV